MKMYSLLLKKNGKSLMKKIKLIKEFLGYYIVITVMRGVYGVYIDNEYYGSALSVSQGLRLANACILELGKQQ